MKIVRTTDKMKKVIEDKIVIHEKLLQAASSEEERHDLNLVLTALKELLKEVGRV